MEKLTECSSIAELISSLVDCWKAFNINHQMAIDISYTDKERSVIALLTEVNMYARYQIVRRIDEVMEEALGQA